MRKHSAQENIAAQGSLPLTSQGFRGIPWWVSLVVILGAALTVTGAVISKVDPTLLTGGNPMNDAARVYADYLFARNLAVAVMLLLLLAVRARRMLAGFMALAALIQVVDILDDLTRGAFVLVPGLIVFAIVFLLGASQLFGHAIWRLDAWRE